MLIIKRIIYGWLLAALIFTCVEPRVHADSISARCAIVYEPFTQSVLYEKEADRQMLVASTTKIMTAKLVIENCSLDEKVEISPAHAAVEGSSMYLRPGGDYTVEQLLYGLMLASGNDAAAALAEHTSGSMEAFAELMNAECEALGLENTHFVNSHGLDAEGHYSSARDLALITAAAMENETFCKLFSTASYTVDGRQIKSHNKLLGMCPGCIGGKTGYTERAGRVLVSCVEREGMRLICVTISDPNDWDDHMALYEKCFGEYEYIPALGEGVKLDIVSGTKARTALNCEKAGIIAAKSEELSIRLSLPPFVFAPVEAGEKVGQADIIKSGKSIGEFGIFSLETVPVDESMRLGFLERLGIRQGEGK